jgi:hypothetical protein
MLQFRIAYDCIYLFKQDILWKVIICKQLRWSRGSVLAFGTQVCGFAPGRSDRIF